jgi:hypothetical protein
MIGRAFVSGGDSKPTTFDQTLEENVLFPRFDNYLTAVEERRTCTIHDF